MSSLVSLVAADGPMHLGMTDGPDVRVLQIALSQAGYRVDITDGTFTTDTEFWLKRFELQHNLPQTGICDKAEADILDAPHAQIIAAATPLVHASGLPHDDTASLIAFYGNPDDSDFDANIVGVLPPFPLTYEGKLWPHPIQLHKKCAPIFEQAFGFIWEKAGKDPASPILRRVSKFSGSWVNRPVRGSSRKSCHAFGAALDVDAEDLPMGHRVDPVTIPQEVVDSFDATSPPLFWGNRYITRPDPMHWQAAHE